MSTSQGKPEINFYMEEFLGRDTYWLILSGINIENSVLGLYDHRTCFFYVQGTALIPGQESGGEQGVLSLKHVPTKFLGLSMLYLTKLSDMVLCPIQYLPRNLPGPKHQILQRITAIFNEQIDSQIVCSATAIELHRPQLKSV